MLENTKPAMGSVSPPPPPSLHAYHQRISQHLLTLMRTPNLPHSTGRVSPMTALSSSVSTGTGTTGTSSGTSGTSGSICSSRSRETSAASSRGPEQTKELTPHSSASAASSAFSPDSAPLLTARPLVPQGLGLGIITASPVISLSTSDAGDEDETYEDGEPTPAGPSYRLTLPDQPAPFIPPIAVPATREEEHRAAWDTEGRKVWKALPPNFQLTLATPKSRRGSNDDAESTPSSSGHSRRRSEEGTPGNTVSERPATMPAATVLDGLGFDVHMPQQVLPGEDEIAVRMGLLVPPRLPTVQLVGIATRVSSSLSMSSALAAGASINISSRQSTSISASASPNTSSSAFSKSSLPEVRRSREERRSSSKKERPKPTALRSVEEELAYEAKLAQRQEKKRSDLNKTIMKWNRGVQEIGDAAIFAIPEILPHIPSPSIASAKMETSPLASAVIFPSTVAPAVPKATRLIDIPTMPLHLIPDTPAAVERTSSPFAFNVEPGKETGPKIAANRSIDLELALRLQALQSLLSGPVPPNHAVVEPKDAYREETLKGRPRLRNISSASGVGKIDEFGAPLRAGQ